jgi:hypothetical protein
MSFSHKALGIDTMQSLELDHSLATGVGEIFGGKFWQHRSVSENLQGLGFAMGA